MEQVQLGKLVKITSGYAFKSNLFNTDQNGLPLIRIRDVVRGYSDTYYDGEYKAEYLIQNGDTLIGMDGEFNLALWNGGKALLNQRVCKIQSIDERLDQDYLIRFLPKVLKDIEDRTPFVTVKHLSVKDLNNILIPLPPLSEQRRIASILDKADELRQKRQQAIEKLDQLLQATFIDMFGDPVSNPKGFKVAKLAEQVDLIQIGPFGTQLHQEDYIENGIPLINPSHIKNGKIIPNDKLTVSKSKHEELTQYHLRLNDVLLGRRGEMGRCAVVTEKEVGWLCGTGSLFIRPNVTNMNPFFLELLLSSDSIKKYLENVSQGQTMANLNKSIVGAIPLILPSIEIQNKFFVISEKVDKMKSEFKNAKNQANNLFESLQNKAFSGNL
ncbi:restriction endonuclease subunit S [Acinetobacter pseudolwoffii]|jgi:type I restriction enzyme S subunit|uniref:restriction endonuclease subunit S n=1 Tax=Acinetobacter pseudolwoffii TaxID=2053287 RepID=UPI002575EDD2|nr:restriction endonuclease subunit S [Acinetobacter pseudolwoffii]MDM1336988.1 restriction endonuclease subunit S [Acinetobacter pseudolwoffii]